MACRMKQSAATVTKREIGTSRACIELNGIIQNGGEKARTIAIDAVVPELKPPHARVAQVGGDVRRPSFFRSDADPVSRKSFLSDGLTDSRTKSAPIFRNEGPRFGQRSASPRQKI
jgi:hypothetical protein